MARGQPSSATLYGKHTCPGEDIHAIIDMHGINREMGCLDVVRPDHYIANVLPLVRFEELPAFFAGVLR